MGYPGSLFLWCYSLSFCFRLPIYKLIYELLTSLFLQAYLQAYLPAYSLFFCFRLPMLLFLPLTRTYVWWKLHIILLFLNCMWQHAWYAMVVKKSGPLLLLNQAVSLPNLGTVHFLMFLICKTLNDFIRKFHQFLNYESTIFFYEIECC